MGSFVQSFRGGEPAEGETRFGFWDRPTLFRSKAMPMEAASAAYVMFLIVSHMTVSSTMLILNKAVLVYLPLTTCVLLAQVGSSAIILWVLGKMKVLTVDGFELKTVSLLVHFTRKF